MVQQISYISSVSAGEPLVGMPSNVNPKVTKIQQGKPAELASAAARFADLRDVRGFCPLSLGGPQSLDGLNASRAGTSRHRNSAPGEMSLCSRLTQGCQQAPPRESRRSRAPSNIKELEDKIFQGFGRENPADRASLIEAVCGSGSIVKRPDLNDESYPAVPDDITPKTFYRKTRLPLFYWLQNANLYEDVLIHFLYLAKPPRNKVIRLKNQLELHTYLAFFSTPKIAAAVLTLRNKGRITFNPCLRSPDLIFPNDIFHTRPRDGSSFVFLAKIGVRLYPHLGVTLFGTGKAVFGPSDRSCRYGLSRREFVKTFFDPVDFFADKPGALINPEPPTPAAAVDVVKIMNSKNK